MTTISWRGGTGQWDDPAHWSSDAVPGADDDVVLGKGADYYYVYLGSSAGADNETVKSLTIGSVGDSPELIIRDDSTLTITGALSLVARPVISVFGGSLILAPGATFANLSDGVLSDAFFEVDPNSTISLSTGSITTLDDSYVSIVGFGASITTGGGATSLEQSLTSISANSVLDVQNQDFLSTNAISNSGRLNFENGSFVSGLLTSTGQLELSNCTVDASIDAKTAVYVYGGVSFSGASNLFEAGFDDSFSGGSVSLDFFAGADVFASALDLRGSFVDTGAALTFEATSKLTNFSLESAIATLGGAAPATLSLFQNSIFNRGVVNGAGLLKLLAHTSIAGLTVGGTATVANYGDVMQQGGTENPGDLVLGDASGEAAVFDNKASGTYDIADASGVGLGASSASAFLNEGAFEKSGAGTSVFAPQMVDNGSVTATAGALDFTSYVFGAGSLDVESGATLEFGAFVVPDLTTSLHGAGASLTLDDAHDFHALIDGFTAGQTIDLAGFAVADDKLLFKPGAGGSYGFLLIQSGSSSANLHFGAAYQTSQFHVADDSRGGTLLTVAPP